MKQAAVVLGSVVVLVSAACGGGGSSGTTTGATPASICAQIPAFSAGLEAATSCLPDGGEPVILAADAGAAVAACETELAGCSTADLKAIASALTCFSALPMFNCQWTVDQAHGRTDPALSRYEVSAVGCYAPLQSLSAACAPFTSNFALGTTASGGNGTSSTGGTGGSVSGTGSGTSGGTSTTGGTT